MLLQGILHVPQIQIPYSCVKKYASDLMTQFLAGYLVEVIKKRSNTNRTMLSFWGLPKASSFPLSAWNNSYEELHLIQSLTIPRNKKKKRCKFLLQCNTAAIPGLAKKHVLYGRSN